MQNAQLGIFMQNDQLYMHMSISKSFKNGDPKRFVQYRGRGGGERQDLCP